MRLDGDAIWTHDQDCSITAPCSSCERDMAALEAQLPSRTCLRCHWPLPQGPWSLRLCPRCAARGLYGPTLPPEPTRRPWTVDALAFVAAALCAAVLGVLLYLAGA